MCIVHIFKTSAKTFINLSRTGVVGECFMKVGTHFFFFRFESNPLKYIKNIDIPNDEI